MDHTSNLKRKRRAATDYTVACLAPLSVELAPLRAMLDAVHDDIPTGSYRNAYVLGEMEHHNVVIAQLPSIGNNDIGSVANQLLHDFPSIRFGLLVGIAGGVPGLNGENDVRLGDVVVSEPKGTTGGVLQFDRGKKLQGERLHVTGHLNKPPSFLMATVKKVAAQHHQQGNKINQLVSDMLRRNPVMRARFKCPGVERDILFEPAYEHTGEHDCSTCDATRTVERAVRQSNETVIHYGTIGSSNAVIRNAAERDDLGRQHNLLSIEMEAAGLMDTFPCLVIRGICDYADSHKNKTWQPYAAAVAAAYAKELLQNIPSTTQPETVEVPTGHVALAPNAMTERPVVPGANTQLPDSSEDHLRVLLESLAFDRMDARLWNIHEPLPQTCKWLFTHDKFRRWIDKSKTEEHHGFLWIKGKPGSGKSTMMKAALRWIKRNRPTEIVISYFFNARAKGDLEKSPLGLYRSVIHQLLQVHSDMKHRFLEMYQSRVKGDTSEQWTVPELTNFLLHIIRSLGDRPVNLFIDALDEGDDSDVRQLVAFLDDLASVAYDHQASFRVCLSSRHYPHISIKTGLELTMEDQPGHKDDIAKFVKKKLAGERGGELDGLVLEIHERAAGIFLWVVLVVPILNRIYDSGGSTADMSLCLQEIPEKLDDLFGQMLARDSDKNDECLSLLQWLLFSYHALTPQELYLAVKATSSSFEVHVSNLSATRLSRYFLNRSRGLAEITKSTPPQVQFIHETVRDFLQQHGLSQMEPSLKGNVIGTCHDKLKVGCESYISATLPSVTNVPHFDRKTHQQHIERQAAFLKYAAENMFKHAEAAEAHGIRQREFLKRYRNRDNAVLESWIEARNAFRKYKVQMYGMDVQLLYVIVDQGLERLVEVLIDDSADVEVRGGRYGCALHAACAVGSDRIVHRLLAAGAHIDAEGGEFEHALFAAIHWKRDSVVNLLLQRAVHPPLLAIQRCLWKTVARGYVKGAEVLMDLGASTNVTSLTGKSLLGLAAERRSGAMAQLLIDRGAAVGIQEALLEACRCGHEQVVRVFIDHDVDVSAQARCADVNGRSSALETACRNSHGVIAGLLIDKGADVNSKGGPLGNVLQEACYEGREVLAHILVDKGANVNLRGGYYGNALQAACAGGHDLLARFLVDRGANVNLRGGHYGNALQAACAGGHDLLARFLIGKAANINAQGGVCGNALQAARVHGHGELARFLVGNGANERSGRIPSQRAASEQQVGWHGRQTSLDEY